MDILQDDINRVAKNLENLEYLEKSGNSMQPGKVREFREGVNNYSHFWTVTLTVGN